MIISVAGSSTGVWLTDGLQSSKLGQGCRRRGQIRAR